MSEDKNYRVEGFVSGEITVYEEVLANSKEEAIDIVRAHYEKNVYMEIKDEELYCEETE